MPLSADEAIRLLTLPKEIEETPDELLAQAATSNGFERGSKREDWNLRIWTQRGVLRATLRRSSQNAPLVGLDHHLIPCRAGIPPGYHFDVYRPLAEPDTPPHAPTHARVHIDHDFQGRLDRVLEMLCHLFGVTLAEQTQLVMR